MSTSDSGIRIVESHCLSDAQDFKDKLLYWSDQFSHCAFLDSNNWTQDVYSRCDLLVGVGSRSIVVSKAGNAFDQLAAFHDFHQDWLFGCLSYDLKNETEALNSSNSSQLLFPDLCFFQPRFVFELKGNDLDIHKFPEDDLVDVFREVMDWKIDWKRAIQNSVHLQQKMDRDYYLSTVRKIKQDIVEGTFYEMNFCQEFFAENVIAHPVQLFDELNKNGKSPYAAYLKLGDQYLLCDSPERFLQKKGSTLLSQPIKGTIRRGETADEDQELRRALMSDPKERAENVMIVDLVRNDLTRSAVFGTIEVEELCETYSFERVHHLISTIRAELQPDKHWMEGIRNAFPMGSMTGAPKIKVMELIELYERSRRGIYSGSVGYISPVGDFDFNVVIRSLMYNAVSQYLSFQIGGAITYDSVPEKEYEECLLKAQGMLRVLHTGPLRF